MGGTEKGSDDKDVGDTRQAAMRGEQRFWRALKPDTPSSPLNNAEDSGSIDVSGDPLQDLSSEELAARRDALRSMLAASEARQQGALKSRRPTLAVGQSVFVRAGPHRKNIGTILDADFIHSRVYLHMDGIDDPQWIEFSHIGAAPTEP